MVILALIFGAIVGFSLGLTGGGGAIFAVPLLVYARTSSARPSDYLIRVNRQPVAPDQVLHDGDRISFTPTKIEGAR